MADRVALVTGANTGIGYAIAERLLRDGFALAYATQGAGASYREPYERLARLGRVHWVTGDLSDPDVPAQLAKDALAALKRIDVLVNNAGLSTSKPVFDLTVDDFDLTFAVDVRAAFVLSQAAAGWMREKGGGAIVNITSVHEFTPRAGFAVYAAAKAALGMLTRGLALELAPFGIRVNAVAPGVIATERNQVDSERLKSEVPLGRAGTPEEVAGLVSWLASDAAAYVTGARFVIDGGMVQQVIEEAAH